MADVKKIAALLLSAGLIGGGTMAGNVRAQETQSLYGCVNLAEAADPPVLEGADGFFFTIMDDIAMQSVADPALVENIADLSKRLRDRGTVLIYAPLPSRSQALSGKVPQSAWIYGYDETVNAELYQEAVARLNAAGVAVVDLLAPMRESADPPFQKADPLWTAEGARLAAEAIGEKIKTMPQARRANLMSFTTTRGEDYTRPSALRDAIQAHCSETIPSVIETRFETTGEEAFAADRPFNILGTDAPAPVVLVGSRFSAGGQSHFDGFLKEYSGMDVDNRAVAEGNPFKSMTDYLDSDAFRSDPPLFLIWEVPPGANLASYGPEPWETLAASASGDCGTEDCGGAPQ